MDWLNSETGTTTPVIPDILNKGEVASLVGQSETGKSLLSFDIALALSTGQSVLGHPANDPMDVVYIDMENPRGEIQRRVTDLGYELPALDRLHYYHMQSIAPLDTKNGGADMQWIAELHSPALIVLDTISKLVTGEESSADTWQDFYKFTLMPLRRRDHAVFILDHQGHDASRGARGSSAKRDNVDIQWIQSRKDDLITLKRDKCRSLHSIEVIKIRRGGKPLRHIVEGDPVTRCVDVLDKLGTPPGIGRERAREALNAGGYEFPVHVITEALRLRKAAQSKPAQEAA